MCWSTEVALTFGIIELISCVILYTRNKARTDRLTLPLLISIMLVEFMEALIWYQGEPQSFTKVIGTEPLACSPLNKYSTIIAVVATWLQPISLSYLHYHIETNTNTISSSQTAQKASISTHLFNIVAFYFFVEAILRLLAGEFIIDINSSDMLKSLLKATFTCSIIGPNGHFIWKQRKLKQPLSNVMYFGVCLGLGVKVIRHPQGLWEYTIPVFGAGVLYVLTGLVLEWTGEVDSVWCWVALWFHIYYLLLPYWSWFNTDNPDVNAITASEQKKKIHQN